MQIRGGTLRTGRVTRTQRFIGTAVSNPTDSAHGILHSIRDSIVHDIHAECIIVLNPRRSTASRGRCGGCMRRSEALTRPMIPPTLSVGQRMRYMMMVWRRWGVAGGGKCEVCRERVFFDLTRYDGVRRFFAFLLSIYAGGKCLRGSCDCHVRLGRGPLLLERLGACATRFYIILCANCRQTSCADITLATYSLMMT